MKSTSELNYSTSSQIQLSSPKISKGSIYSITLINRITLFVIYFWFGFLKIIQVSPAEKLVEKLYNQTLYFIGSQEQFVIFLGIIECIIGTLWLFPRLTKVAFWIFIIHMFTTFLPFLFLTNDIVSNGFQLSLVGQYIVKNLVLVACAYTIYFLYKLRSSTENNTFVIS